jgi:O-acetyl-ADP-ribose deacetylase (regulator of RNase III)
LPYKSIIHVAGINMFWCGTEYSVAKSVESAMNIVNEKKYKSVAFPLIGSGSGNRGKDWSFSIMESAFSSITSDAKVLLVKYAKK